MATLRFALCASLLTALLAVPGLEAHLDPGQHLPPSASTGLDQQARGGPGTLDPHLGDAAHGNGLDRVAGWYHGPARLEAGRHGVSVAGICDLEVVGAGADEGTIDGSAYPAGAMPDGTFNDGGQGGACHPATAVTLLGDPLPDEYATPGCAKYADPSSPSYGNARAEDLALGSDVWILVGCDLVEPNGHVDPCRECEVACTVAGLQAGEPRCLLDPCRAVEPLEQGCLFAPPWTLGHNCAADGLIDVFSTGEGGGASGAGVPFPAIPADWQACDGGGAAYVLVLAAVHVDVGEVEHIAVPTSGWIA